MCVCVYVYSKCIHASGTTATYILYMCIAIFALCPYTCKWCNAVHVMYM